MANVKDGATGTVLTAPSTATAGTSLVLNSGEGARMPDPPFYAIAHPNNTIPTVSTAEKILVTAVSTDTITIVRAQGIYTAKSIAVGWRISNAIFQDDLNNASIISNEVPAGTVDGSNTGYTVASAGKVTGSLKVFKNGVRMKGSGNDFTETATGFTMATAPASGTLLLVDYIVAGAINNVGTNSSIFDEAVTGSVNGTNDDFTTLRPYIAGSLVVYVNGLRQAKTTHVTEVSPAAGTFSLDVAPLTGDIVRVDYQFNLNPSGNADTVDGFHAETLSPVGVVLPYAGVNAPTNWLFCYGQAISRTSYPQLFAELSTTYGTGDGSTTFNLPDMRGRVPAGQDDMGGSSANRLTNPGSTGGLDGDTLGNTGGQETHAQTIGELAVHNHGVSARWFVGTGSTDTNHTSYASSSSGGGGNVTSTSTGSGTAFNVVQPTIILNYIIRVA